MIDWPALVNAAVQSLVFSSIGLIFFGITFLLISKLTPFSIRKEIEEDQNTALGVMIGAVIIGVAMIVSATLGS